MSSYLPEVASKPLVMMRETAGIQVGMDFCDEQDAMRKFRLALKLSPVVSAIFSNSPVRNGKLTKYKSYRALSWLSTDNARCGLVSPKIFKKKSCLREGNTSATQHLRRELRPGSAWLSPLPLA